MQSSKLKWKKIKEGTYVTHFSSGVTSDQIYLKKISGTKSSSQKEITIFLFHDLASYHGRFLNLIKWFQVQHPHVSFVMMDFVGHGLSSGTRGHIEHFDYLVNDVVQVFKSFEKKENESWVALGHGIGALSLLDLVNRFDDSIKGLIDQFIFSNFVLQFSSPLLQMQNKMIESFLPLVSALKTTRPLEIYLAEEILTHSREQGQYLEDPLIVRRPTFQTFKCVNIKLKSIFQDSYFLDRPCLILKSESPYLTRNGMSSFSKGLKKGLLVEKKYSNLKHDLYNEKDNLNVFNDIAEWIHS